MLIAVIAFLFYGGSLWGVTPLVPGFVSWEMHLFGFIAGILAAQLSFVGGSAEGNWRRTPADSREWSGSPGRRAYLTAGATVRAYPVSST